LSRVIPSLSKVAGILGFSFDQTGDYEKLLSPHPESRPSKRPGTAHDAVADTVVTAWVVDALSKNPHKVARDISEALGWGDSIAQGAAAAAQLVGNGVMPIEVDG